MYGREVVTTGERLDIETLSAHDAALLQVEPGEPALSLACLSFDATGCVVEYSNSLCRADREATATSTEAEGLVAKVRIVMTVAFRQVQSK